MPDKNRDETLTGLADFDALANDKGKYPRGQQKLLDLTELLGKKFILGSVKQDKEKQAKKALANHLWYMANKGKKQQYNEQYYKDNIEYWRKRYQEAKNKLSGAVDDEYKQTKKEIAEERERNERTKKEVGFDNWPSYRQADYKRVNDNLIDMGEKLVDEAYKSVRSITKGYEASYAENLKRAHREYQEFLDSQKKMSFGEAWKSGAKSIVNTGKGFINKLLGR